MERRQYIATLGVITSSGIAGCGEDEPSDTTDGSNNPTTDTNPGGDQQSIPDGVSRKLLQEEDLPAEENWSLVDQLNQREGWYTRELERTDEDDRLHVLYSDIWLYEDSGTASEEYDNRHSSYQDEHDTTNFDIGDDGIGWVNQIAVALFYEDDAIGQIEYQVYDDGELTGATIDDARKYAQLMYEKW